jgi:hypothetical protein
MLTDSEKMLRQDHRQSTIIQMIRGFSDVAFAGQMLKSVKFLGKREI